MPVKTRRRTSKKAEKKQPDIVPEGSEGPLEFESLGVRIPEVAEDSVLVSFKPGPGKVTIRTSSTDKEYQKGYPPFILEGGRVAVVSREEYQQTMQPTGRFELC